jgi:predicted nucleic acid-binding protein
MKAALENVRALLAQPRIRRIDPGSRHLEVFAEVCAGAGSVAGNFVHDCRIAAIMLENGVSRILTRDTMFRRIPGIEVVDPFV